MDPTTGYSDPGAVAGLVAFYTTYAFVMLIFAVIMIIAYWKVFTKAGEAGWQSIIPIWNVIVILKIAGRPWWWLLLMLIPLVQIVVLFVVYLDIAKSFGHGIGFALGLFFLAPIFWLILGFGSSRYVGPAGSPQRRRCPHTPHRQPQPRRFPLRHHRPRLQRLRPRHLLRHRPRLHLRRPCRPHLRPPSCRRLLRRLQWKHRQPRRSRPHPCSNRRAPGCRVGGTGRT